jgi:hypothetical protein
VKVVPHSAQHEQKRPPYLSHFTTEIDNYAAYSTSSQIVPLRSRTSNVNVRLTLMSELVGHEHCRVQTAEVDFDEEREYATV